MKAELVTTLKRQATRLIAELKEDPEPVLITEHGRPAAYLVNIADYIALDKPDAATRYVRQVFAAVERLARFSNN